MATLQKIRSKGPLLVIVIGLALFAFIAGDAWKILQPHTGVQDAGEIDGEKIPAQDFQASVEEYAEVIKLTSGMSSLNDDQMAELRDEVWNNLINTKIIQKEADKLGLTVTNAEIEDAVNQGTNPLLMQMPFRNQQTGTFDKDMLKKVLADYAKDQKNPSQQVQPELKEYRQRIFKLWTFVEKRLKENLLQQKYQAMIVKGLVSNPVEAKQAFDERTTQTDLLLAAIPYTAIADSTIKVSDSEVKELYNKKKEQFKQYIESRNIKYVDVQVSASAADRKVLQDEMAECTNQLASKNDDFAAFVRSTNSTIPYSDVPVSKTAYPSDIAARLDSIATGEAYGPYYNQADNTINSFKIIARESTPDSIQFRMIQAVADSEDKIKTLADSIYNAVKGGADFAAIAKKYGQTGESTWLASKSYEGSVIEGDNAKYLNTLNNLGVNETANLSIGQGNIIVQVLNKKGASAKYKVAVVKRPVEFSKETYNKAYNDFSQFVASNPTLKDMEANAESKGYHLLDRQDIYNNEHNVNGIHSTRDVMKWIFSAKKGDVSQLFECGDNDHMMVVALTGINEKGYSPMEKVAELLKAEIIKDKKAEQLMTQMNKAKSFAEAKSMPNAINDTVKHVTFAAPTFVGATRASEPALTGAAAKAQVNQLAGPVKGDAAVYSFQVINRTKTNDKFDEKAEETAVTQTSMRAISRFMNDLYLKANIVDNRYLFF